jgi:hypothetical protein
MTAADRFDRHFADMLADVAQPAFPDYIDDVLDLATRGSQRPAWTFPERWLPMRSLTRSVPFAPGVPWRNLGILALIALLAAALLAIAIGTQRQPAPPYGLAANGVITYQLDGDIYTRPLIDGQPRLIGGGPDVDVTPLFSLDGTKVAFVRIDPDQDGFGTSKELASLVVANADGSDLRTVFGPTTFYDWLWSSDSRSLVVTAPGRAGRELSIVPIDGSAPRTFSYVHGIVGNVIPRPPDDRELITLLASGGRARFFAIPLDGGTPRQITSDDMLVPKGGLFVVTPDGRQIVYEYLGEDAMSLHVQEIDTGADRAFGEHLPPLEPGIPGAGAPRLSADGTQLIFGRWWNGDETMINHQMWTASLAGDGSDAKPIGEAHRTPGGVLPYQYATSPDGTQIVVHLSGSSETWSTSLQGKNLQTLDIGDLEWIDWQRLAP